MPDQRYCLECGERRATVSEFLRAGPPRESSAPASAPPGARPPAFLAQAAAPRGNLVSLLAGIGVLLLAMGVGVLIGRSGTSSSRAPAPQVVSISSGAGTPTSSASEESFTSNWPAGKKGYTVELQTLPSASKVAAVEAAKSAAGAKGAKSVGALKAEEFPSVGGEGFVVYSGEYSKKAEAQKAAGALKRSFPGAKVVEVSGATTSTSKATTSSGSGTKSPTGPPTTAKSFEHAAAAPSKHGNGKKFVEESAKLPNVVETK